MDIDFIKWMCDKAEGFEFEAGDFIDDNYIRTPDTDDISQSDFNCGLWIEVLYPLLLQRAIEGVNKLSYYQNNDREIVQYRWGIQILNYSTDNHHEKHWRFEEPNKYNVLKAKESALKYIWEMESNHP